jgi:DNA-binding SARP family transcriptional activator/tetratricopeptide (TPR) repeat protein
MGASEVVETVVRLLGPGSVSRGGVPITLPRSRKVRALLAFLAASPRPLPRSRLCGLLWDVPSDPRGELRWCLSKLRALLDDDRRHRVVTDDDLVSLDLSDCRVDTVEVDGASAAGIEQATTSRLAELSERFAGDLLDGMDVDGSPEFTGWLSAQRSRYRGIHVDVLRTLATRAGDPAEASRWIVPWLRVAPFDPRAHQMMLEGFARTGRRRDAECHLTAAIRSFEAEGIDWTPLQDTWRSIRIEVSSQSVAPSRARPRASVAVMPFTERGGAPDRIADGLTEDIIVQLAKLRVLFVIARGSTFALGARGLSASEAGRLLDVDYVVTGTIRRESTRLTVIVELADVRDGTIVWTDALPGSGDEMFAALDAIVQRIVAAVAEEIETAESRRAVLKPPSSLDAWEAYHRGLWHMYKFTGDDNRHAEQFLRSALELDPVFARAYAALSFTHFQNAFLDLTPDRDRQIELAYETASHSLGADDRDPAAHWAMGRALWLRGAQSESVAELERSIDLSPNFALGHYTLGFVHSQKGDPRAAIDATNHSRQLSPFDPLQFAMLASRAIAHVRLDQRDEAASWAVKATGRPNAHAHILAIAAECLALADRRDEARQFVAQIRARLPAYNVESFLRAFKFEPDVAQLFRGGARQIGFAG